MKKSIVSVILALVLSLSCVVLFGCGDEETASDSIGTVGTTLTLWLPAAKGSEVDDEAVINVENAINEFTQKNFSTAIKLKVFPAEEYDALVLSKIYEEKQYQDMMDAAAAAERKANRDKKKNTDTNTDTGSDAETEAESVTESAAVTESDAETDALDSVIEIEKTDPNLYILPADENDKRPYDYEYEHAYMNASVFASYPAVESSQFDIFLIHGFDEFKLLYDDMLICELPNNVSAYVNPAFIKGATYGGVLSAIPNNRPAGEIGVMLINKSVCEKLYYDPERIDSVEKLFTYDDSGISFIEDVKNSLPGITPVVGNYTPSNVRYFSKDDDGSFSLVSALVSPDIDRWDSFGMDNVFRNGNFVKSYALNKRIGEIIKPADIDSAGEFAVGFFKGTYEELQKYKEDYQIVTLQNPQLSREDVFESAFAVSAFTKNADRAMEIIDAINTNTELRTIIQYGAEGVHWRYDVEDPSVIHVLSDKYKMDLKETGNCFMTYPGDGLPISAWDDAKEYNLKLFLPYTYGFASDCETTSALLDDLKRESAGIFARIEAMTYTEFNEKLEDLRNEVDNLDCYKKLTHVFGINTEEDKDYIEDESLPVLFLDYVNVRGW